MIGYITIYQPDMKFRDYYRYREYYCGLCRSLKKNHGETARLSLGYDMTFLAVLLDGVYDSETGREPFRCAAHPFGKKYMLTNNFINYAADMNLYMAYLKCEDDWQDDRNITRKAYGSMIKGRAGKIGEKYPEKTEKIKKHLGRLTEFEKAQSTDFEGAADCFGYVTAELFRYGGIWDDGLAAMGFYLGKYIYLLDAYEDLEEDLKKGRYNPFRELCREDDFDRKVKEILMSMISESAEEFEMLPVDENMDILRNIIYAGVWQKFEDIVSQRQAEECSACEVGDGPDRGDTFKN